MVEFGRWLDKPKLRAGRHSWRSYVCDAVILFVAYMDIIACTFLAERKNAFYRLCGDWRTLLGAFVMLYNPQLGGLPLPNNNAEWLALASGIGFSLTNVITRKSSHLSLAAKSFSVWVGVMLVAALSMPFIDGKFASPNLFTATNWVVMGVIAILLLAATLFVQYGVTRIAATRASILFLFELVVAAIASYYLANEQMSVNEWIGGSFIVFAAILLQVNIQILLSFGLLPKRTWHAPPSFCCKADF